MKQSSLQADEIVMPDSGTVKKMVMFLHGYGSNGADLISIAPQWQKNLKDTVFISPNAPFTLNMFMGGYQWFGLERFDPDYLLQGSEIARPILDAFIDAQLDEYDLEDKDLALVGFSQGTMMALTTALQRPKQIAGVVGYSGALVMNNLAKIKSKPPIVLVHGDMDPVVPVDASVHARDALLSQGIACELHHRPFLPHGIDEEGIKVGRAFLERVLTV